MADHPEPIEPPATLSEESAAAMENLNSIKVTLADLCAKGTAQYARKNYVEATDLYAQAAEIQDEVNGEMSPDNAEILFLYGRAQFKVGVSNSDVLGGKSGGAEKKKPNGAKSKKPVAPKKETSELDRITEEGVAIVAEQNGHSVKPEETDAKKPLFQFTGDENFEDSDEDEEPEEEPNGEDDEDDLGNAYEVLEIARVLFEKKLDQPDENQTHGTGKGKDAGDSPMTKHIKERLSDTHDLLAEICLENERFPEAVTDFRSALAHKLELYPEDSPIIAEAHFKLSLALEFASITSIVEPGEEDTNDGVETHLDQGLRDEAVKELEAAINSTKLRLHNKEVELASSADSDDNEILRAQIIDVKEMVAEMEGRLVELNGPGIDLKEALYGPGALAGINPIGGILGATLGETPADAAARLEEAKKTATDVSGLIRKKAKSTLSETPASTNGTNGKRKLEEDVEEDDSNKKVKVEKVHGSKQANSDDVEEE